MELLRLLDFRVEMQFDTSKKIGYLLLGNLGKSKDIRLIAKLEGLVKTMKAKT